jgi:UDP-GlcNAc:undecaprenyl-phosphate GlcNAc-1-phosphate transferase
VNLAYSIGSALAGFLVVFFGIRLLLKLSARGYLGHRVPDLHHSPGTLVPRLGGLALAAAFTVIQLLTWNDQSRTGISALARAVLALSSLAMFGLGFWDDLSPLGARKKLLVQILIAAIPVACGMSVQHFKLPFTGTIIDLHGWGVLVTIIWLVGLTNLINLVDGIDGLAGGICLMLMSLLAYQSGDGSGGTASGMVGALLGFLWFNFPPARIYMGDSGAYFLGFQIGLMSIASSQKGTIMAALAAPLFVLALPIVDVTLAILRRGLRGLPLFRPDRRHLHHHLINMGLSRREVVLSIYSVTLVFLVMGFAAFWSRGQLVPVLLGLAALILLLFAGKLSFSREWFAVGRVLGNSLSMRQEVQYALTLTRWLELEGARRQTISALWPDLVFVAHRLGFTGMKLTLAGEERSWRLDDFAGETRSLVQELRSGRCGTLELFAPAEECAPENSDSTMDEHLSCPRLSDLKLFEIMAELMAEAWLNATRRWARSSTEPLSFNCRVREDTGNPRRRSLQPLLRPTSAPAHLTPPGLPSRPS